jgi:hypothetical protein
MVTNASQRPAVQSNKRAYYLAGGHSQDLTHFIASHSSSSTVMVLFGRGVPGRGVPGRGVPGRGDLQSHTTGHTPVGVTLIHTAGHTVDCETQHPVGQLGVSEGPIA